MIGKRKKKNKREKKGEREIEMNTVNSVIQELGC
jgi:hypothetical protein